jgi:hypothetical protein
LTVLVETVAGILHQKMVNLLTGGQSIDHPTIEGSYEMG